MEGIINRITTLAGGRQKVREQTGGEALIALIRQTGREIEAVRSRFDLETDFDLIDSFVMELNALERRYDYLIKEAKRERVTADYRLDII